MENKIIEVQHISKIIKNNKILDDVSFGVEQGKIVGLIGPNGAGKTTLLKIMCGLDSMTSGNVKINSISINEKKELICSTIGVLIETTSGYDNLSGYENIKMIADMYKGISKDQISYIIKLLDMESFIHKKFKTYSLGMKQRLGIGISLLNEPQIILLDEPANGLDIDGIRDLRKLITLLANKDKITFIISSHIMGELDAICNEAIFLSKGKIISIVNMEDVKNGLEDYYIKLCGKEVENYEVFD